MRTSEALDSYIQQLRADGRSPHTTGQARRFVLMLVGAMGDPPVGELRHEDLARFLASQTVTKRADGGPRKPNSANALRSVLRAFFAFVHAAGYTATNPARLVRRARCGPPRPRSLSPHEAERLIATLDTATTAAERRDRALFRSMLGLGLRVGSVVALDVEDLDLEGARLQVRTLKNSDSDVVFVPIQLVALLREHVGERTSGPLFARTSGERIGVRQVGRRLEEWAVRAGIERNVNPHALRHAFAMTAYERTGDVLLVSRLLLHRSLASTAVYARPSDAQLRGAMSKA